MSEFDYGPKKENGQYTNYPSLDSVDLNKVVIPVGRDTYVHLKCGVATKVGHRIAATYQVNPKYYSHTFCVGCKDHLPVGEFQWDDGSIVGDKPGMPEPKRLKYESESIRTTFETYEYESEAQQEEHMERMKRRGYTVEVGMGNQVTYKSVTRS